MDNGTKPNAIGSMVPIFGGNATSVFGPGASTNLAVVRWNGVTGTLLLDTPTWTYDGVSQTLNGGIVALNHTADSVAIGTGAGNVGVAAAVSTTSVGSGALAAITTGVQCSAFGYQAGNAITTNDGGTFVGYQAGLLCTAAGTTLVGDSAGVALTSGTGITAVGYQAGNAIVVGINGTFVGYQAGLLTTGGNNTFVGATCGSANTAGARNTLLGAEAGDSFVNSADNTCIGYRSGSGALGNQNTLVGRSAGQAIIASDVVAVGYTALTSVATQVGTVALGHGSLTALTSGANHVAVGYQSGNAIVTNDDSTSVGYQTLLNATGGSNTALGARAGDLLTTGTGCILIGVDADPPANNTTNFINVGAALFGDTASARFRVGGGVVAIAGDASIRCAATDAAFMPNVLTTAQRNALAAEDGMIIYNSTTGQHEGRKAGAWVAMN